MAGGQGLLSLAFKFKLCGRRSVSVLPLSATLDDTLAVQVGPTVAPAEQVVDTGRHCETRQV